MVAPFHISIDFIEDTNFSVSRQQALIKVTVDIPEAIQWHAPGL